MRLRRLVLAMIYLVSFCLVFLLWAYYPNWRARALAKHLPPGVHLSQVIPGTNHTVAYELVELGAYVQNGELHARDGHVIIFRTGVIRGPQPPPEQEKEHGPPYRNTTVIDLRIREK
jgi:hypothetical protein